MFHVTCSLSKLNIKENDKVYFVILKENQMVFNDGVTPSFVNYNNELFKPFAFPIEATYDGDGGLKDIKRTENTKALEKRFNLKIHDLLAIVNCKRGVNDKLGELYKQIQNKKLSKEDVDCLKGLSGMFIHHEVYKHFILNKLSKEKVKKTKEKFNTCLVESEEKMDKINQAFLEKKASKEDVLFFKELFTSKYSNQLKNELNWFYYTTCQIMFSSLLFDVYKLNFLKLPKEFLLMYNLFIFMTNRNLLFIPSISNNDDENDEKVITYYEEIINLVKKENE